MAPASTAFSTSSFTTALTLTATWPAHILAATWSEMRCIAARAAAKSSVAGKAGATPRRYPQPLDGCPPLSWSRSNIQLHLCPWRHCTLLSGGKRPDSKSEQAHAERAAPPRASPVPSACTRFLRGYAPMVRAAARRPPGTRPSQGPMRQAPPRRRGNKGKQGTASKQTAGSASGLCVDRGAGPPRPALPAAWTGAWTPSWCWRGQCGPGFESTG